MNHLAKDNRGLYLKLTFRNTSDFNKVRNYIQPIVNQNKRQELEAEERIQDSSYGTGSIMDMREHDVVYHLRVAIDCSIRAGLWYTVSISGPKTILERVQGKDVRPDPIVLAFDIETCKQPLKFPDAASGDQIMMISYMIDGRGFLIVNRSVVSQDIENFEYTPLPEYPGRFSVMNEADEKALLHRFLSHIQLVRPHIVVTYNGDFFDWPYVNARCEANGISVEQTIGFKASSMGGEYGSSYCLHMDCFCWVKRDSYLPAGSQGLKAVAHAKLGYDPLELDPEEMTPLAQQDPQTLANYSVSDAVATYYLYMKYVHPFIFSLCNLIPLTPDEVLRKGSGTLCETLLMAQAQKANIIFPNKHVDPKEQFHDGHMLANETYVGGHVEALEAGVFRSDINYKFHIKESGVRELISQVDQAIKFFVETEKASVEDVVNYDQVRGDILARLSELGENLVRDAKPLIYHLDVGAMYPNIILTNRLQPPAMVTDSVCARCDYNDEDAENENRCKRKMQWSWRGEYYSANRSEFRMIKGQLEKERFPSKWDPKTTVAFHELSPNDQNTLLEKRLADYSQKVYKRIKNTTVEKRTSIVCQRENSFYIDTVRSFRDHRYTYKSLCKVWKKRLDEAEKSGEPALIEEADKMHTVYDSLQLAHKCILNSFYGYVMRKGARWYSMEMGGIVCETGADIIKLAREMVEKVGRPLELDTDGIWCMLPETFPQNYQLELKNGKKLFCSYPCVMLNHLVHEKFTNDQYANLQDDGSYKISEENSIYFEIDGPYAAMILPSSLEEGKQLKKRYAVFKKDGSLAELKGFELKRRGELKLVKVFQTQLFKTYLEGSNLKECYAAVARIANHWLTILHSHGSKIDEEEIFELLSENRSMSKTVAEYGEQKSTSITTARRLAEFLGEGMIKDKGLACKFVIANKPTGTPVAVRAIPVAIFSAEPHVRVACLRRWLKDPRLGNEVDIRSLLDWDYYLERFEGTLRKLIVIPAALQGVGNPLPRVQPPDWLKKRNAITLGRQMKLTDMFSTPTATDDIEDAFSRKLLFSPTKQESKQDDDKENIVIEDEIVNEANWNTDFLGYVRYQKMHVWPQMRVKIRNADHSQKSVMMTFVKSEEEVLAAAPWQIISMEPTGRPGYFAVWIWQNQALKRMELLMERTLYIHMNKPIEALQSGMKECFLKPLNTERKHLYELKVEEETFERVYSSIKASFDHPDVEGIYEAQIPLQTQILLSLQPVMKANKNAKNFSDLKTDPPASVRYLDDFENYLYLHVEDDHVSTGRCVWVLFARGNEVVRVFITDPAMKRHAGSNFATLYQQLLPVELNLAASGIFRYSGLPEFEVNYYPEVTSMRKSVNHALRSLPNHILLCNAQESIDFMPMVNISGAEEYQPLPPLDWQRLGIRKGIEAYFGVNQSLSRMMDQSKYSQIPIGCLGTGDIPLDLGDLFWARTLKVNGFLIPSVGDEYEDERIRMPDAIISRPGGSATGAQEIVMQSFVANSVRNYSEINSASIAGNPWLTCCRTMINNWIESIPADTGEELSVPELMIQHFVRWLYDRAPSRLKSLVMASVYRALSKLVNYLEADLGFGVLYADPQRVLFTTSKRKPVRITLQKEFELVVVLQSRRWNTLVWMGWNDYGGTDERGEYDEGEWNMQEHLPVILQKPFALCVKEFFISMDKEEGSDAVQEHVKELFIRLVLSVSKLMNGPPQNKAEVKQRQFPKIIGGNDSHKPVSPTLEFIKSVGAVFSQVETVRDDAALLMEKAFSLIQVSAFSPQAEFVNPALSLAISGLFCRACGKERNVDFGRDLQLPHLNCHFCPSSIPRGDLERIAVRWVHVHIMQDAVSDWACKCKAIKVGKLRRCCEACGSLDEWRKVQPRDASLLLLLKRIAEAYEFEKLKSELANF